MNLSEILLLFNEHNQLFKQGNELFGKKLFWVCIEREFPLKVFGETRVWFPPLTPKIKASNLKHQHLHFFGIKTIKVVFESPSFIMKHLERNLKHHLNEALIELLSDHNFLSSIDLFHKHPIFMLLFSCLLSLSKVKILSLFNSSKFMMIWVFNARS